MGRVRRTTRSKATGRRKLHLELLEKRTLLSAAGFVQGFAYLPGGGPKVGATIELLGGTGSPVLQTATTNADGYYQFSVAPGTYNVVENAPAYVPSVSIQTTINQATAIPSPLGSGQAIQVTVLNPATTSFTVTQNTNPAGATTYFQLNASSTNSVGPFNSSTSGGDNSHQFSLALSGNAGNLSTIYSVCSDLFDATRGSGTVFTVSPSLTPNTTTQTADLGALGYLYNNFGTTLQDPAGTGSGVNGAGLQLARLALEYDAPTDPTITGSNITLGGNFQLVGTNNTAVVSAANSYLSQALTAQSSGRSENAYFLNWNGANPPNGSVGGQAQVATDLLNFNNGAKPTPTINTQQQPALAYVGEKISDTATVTGLVSPSSSDTVTFNLYSSSTVQNSSTLLFTDTETVTINGGTATATSAPYAVAATGTDYWVATFNGDGNNAKVSSGAALEPVAITPFSPSINTTQQPASAVVGSSIADKATVTGYNPTGTVTFNLYANATASGTPLFSDTEPLVGGVATSAGYTTTAAGTDYWVATYNGDTNNAKVTSGAALEPVAITPFSPSINTTQQPASAVVGSSIADKATVTGYNPTGTVTFNLYANATASGTPLFSDTEPLVGGVATSAGYTTTAAGTDYWVATYNGDTNNAKVTSGAALEPVAITPFSPSINTTQQPASAVVGSSIADEATVSGGYNPTGTVTFNLYANATASGTPLFSDTEPLVGGVATSAGYTTTAAGTDYWVATYNGDTNNAKVTSGAALEPVAITPFSPSINTTQQPASAVVGSSIADTATVSGGYNPTGTVTFNLYANATASGTPLFSDTEPLVGGVATSAGYTTTAAGTDYWVATYNGDTNNAKVTSGAALEPVAIAPFSPSINTTQQPASAVVGSSIADEATVSGGYNPTGTVTFNLYANATASGTPLFSDTEPLVGGVATSAGYTTTTAGTDYWVATYNGDTNNAKVTSGAALEPVAITPFSPSINTTQQPASAVVGSSIADTATVSGGYNPTGTVTFNLYANATASGTPLFSDTEPLVGGVATSAGYTTTAAGTDYWVATYNGDTNNAKVTSGAALEPVAIAPFSPSINTTQQPASAVVGSSIADEATVSGGYNPTGTVTFNLYANATASGTPLFSDTEPLVGGVATSAGYTTTAAGTDYWVATYNGDTNNAKVTSGAALEPVAITPFSPSINTTQQPASAVVGSSIADTATVSGGYNPTGTVTFNLYANATASGTPLFSDTEPLVGGVATSAGYTTTTAGTDYWVATYNGDTNNAKVTSGAALEPVAITPFSPSINTTQQPASAVVGSSIADTATVSGYNPTGTVTFNLYANATASGTPLFSDTEPLVGGVATSAGYTTTATGTDYWVATYNGDTNNAKVTSGAALEPVAIAPFSPSINTTQQPASAVVGSSIADKATVTGYNPTGTVTFNLYANATASGTPLFSDTEPLVGGVATSAGYTTAAAGTDYWVATYNGDTNNAKVTSGAALEPVSITTANRIVVIGPDKSTSTPEIVKLVNATTGQVLPQVTPIMPYGSTFQGGIRVAAGDLNGDGIDEIVTAPGRGIAPKICVFSQDGTLLTSFLVYPSDPSYIGGVQVAVGDVDGDGKPDIITVNSFGPAKVRVFRNLGSVGGIPSFDTTNIYRDFLAFPSSFIGGAVVAAADVGTFSGGTFVNTLDGKAEIIVGSDGGTKATVNVFDVEASGAPPLAPLPLAAVQTIYPFSTTTTTFSGGLSLAMAKIDGDAIPDIVVGAGDYGGSAVEVWGWKGGSPPAAASLTELQSFTTFADSPTSYAPVRVAAFGGMGGTSTIVGVQGPAGTAGQIRTFNVAGTSPFTATPNLTFSGFPGPWFIAAVDSPAPTVHNSTPATPPGNLGVFAPDNSTWYFDLNGNGSWDAGDSAQQLSGPGVPVAGDWDGSGRTEPGFFDNGTWYLDTAAGMEVFNFGFASSPGNQVVPVVGDWNGDGKTEVGVYCNGAWFRDVDGSHTWNAANQAALAYLGWNDGGTNSVVPVPGYWAGDGKTEMGVYCKGVWFLDSTGNNQWDGSYSYWGWNSSTLVPVAGNWSDSGTKDQFGVYNQGVWFRDYDGTHAWDAANQAAVAYFGWAGAQPVVGRWDGSTQAAVSGKATPIAVPEDAPAALAPNATSQTGSSLVSAAAVDRWLETAVAPSAPAAADHVASQLPAQEGGSQAAPVASAGDGATVDPLLAVDVTLALASKPAKLAGVDPQAVDRLLLMI